MVAVKAHLAQGFLKSPDPKLSAFLFFGSDPGLVSERSMQLAKRLAESETPPGEVLRLDDTDLESDPDRLAIELRTIPMFGGKKFIRATMGRRITAASIKPLIEEGGLAGVLIVEAGNLKPDDAMRAAFEKSASAAAIACYADEAQDLAALVRDVLGQAKMSISPEAQQMLVARLGADRTLSRGEIEKLVLYARGKAQIEADDVEAIVGDASELAIDNILLATASGDSGRAIRECSRAAAAGESAQTIILAAQRYFQRLHRVRIALDEGRQFDDAIRQLRPPLFFKHKPAFSAQLRQWSSKQLVEALTEIAAAAKAARLGSALEEPIAERLLWSLAQRSKQAIPAKPGR